MVKYRTLKHIPMLLASEHVNVKDRLGRGGGGGCIGRRGGSMHGAMTAGTAVLAVPGDPSAWASSATPCFHSNQHSMLAVPTAPAIQKSSSYHSNDWRQANGVESSFCRGECAAAAAGPCKGV